MLMFEMIIPVIMLVAGFMMYANPPKEINGFIGYRSRMSRKNINTWIFAHDFCGKLWAVIGIVMLGIIVIAEILFGHLGIANKLINGAIIAIQLIILVVSHIPVERALRRSFDEEGKRRSA